MTLQRRDSDTNPFTALIIFFILFGIPFLVVCFLLNVGGYFHR